MAKPRNLFIKRNKVFHIIRLGAPSPQAYKCEIYLEVEGKNNNNKKGFKKEKK